MLNIAKENAVSETAFFLEQNGELHLRWFTPDIEIDLCGHATLATAFVIKSQPPSFNKLLLKLRAVNLKLNGKMTIGH